MRSVQIEVFSYLDGIDITKLLSKDVRMAEF
jgi:hypothetical protein